MAAPFIIKYGIDDSNGTLGVIETKKSRKGNYYERINIGSGWEYNHHYEKDKVFINDGYQYAYAAIVDWLLGRDDEIVYDLDLNTAPPFLKVEKSSCFVYISVIDFDGFDIDEFHKWTENKVMVRVW